VFHLLALLKRNKNLERGERVEKWPVPFFLHTDRMVGCFVTVWCWSQILETGTSGSFSPKRNRFVSEWHM